MKKNEVSEIRRRFTKEGSSFTKLAACYVSAKKEKVTTFRENFQNLEEEELYKYLEIAKKSLSGTIGNNLIELPFPAEAEEEGGIQDLLMKIRKSGLTDDDLLNTLYDRIIESYDNPDNYLIVLFHDAYDVPVKTKDNMALDDSEEVYEYLIVSICPVDLTKPGLGYDPDENRITSLPRDWAVGAVESAFTFPCFTDRSADIHSVLCYTKNALTPHTELWEDILSCPASYTTSQKRAAFSSILGEALGDPKEDEDAMDSVVSVQDHLNAYIEGEEKRSPKDSPIIMEKEDLTPILTDAGIDPDVAGQIGDRYEEVFKEDRPEADEILDSKVLKNGKVRLEKIGLEEEVKNLYQKLDEAGVTTSDSDRAIYIRVPDEKADEIGTAYVDGRRSLVIPLDGDEETTVNGEVMDF